MRKGLLFGVLASIVAVACDKVPLFAPQNSTITLNAGTRTLAPGTSTEITAFVLESAGTPVQNGTAVRFTTSLGRVEPAEVQTRDGLATVTFHAGDVSGTAEVRATSGGVGGGTTTTPPTTGGTTTTTTSSNAIQIQVGGAATAAVLVSATPSTVPSQGGTVTISASAVDASGNRLRGVPVSFSTTAGTLSASSAISDQNGEATVTLTTNRAATVTVRAGNQTATATIAVGTPAGIGLTISPTAPLVRQPVTLTITPTIATGGVAPLVTVNWGDGTTETVGVVASARTVTHVYQSAGSYTIGVTAVADGETTVASIGVTVGSISVGLTAAGPASGTRTVTFTANVLPAGAADLVQSYTWDFGDGITATTSGNSTTHVYASAGTRTVTVLVQTTTGVSATGRTEVSIP
jgi:hypothetical protein